MHEHDGYVPHSHEVRADHLGVRTSDSKSSAGDVPKSQADLIAAEMGRIIGVGLQSMADAFAALGARK